MDAIFGTAGYKVSPRCHGIRGERDVFVKMRDGVRINVDVFRPDSSGKFPALLAVSAFPKDLQSTRAWPAAGRSRRINGSPDAAIEAGPTDFFVRRGYVHIIGNVRGTGKSEGRFQFVSPQEIEDTYQLIEWAAAQPWCNGNVGMLGIGDAGTYHPLVAVLQPPHLKAIAPLASFWDAYREFWWPGGILAHGFLRWIVSLVNLDVHTQDFSLQKEIGAARTIEAVRRALLDPDIQGAPALIDALKNGHVPPNAGVNDVLLHPLWAAYWRERSVLDLARIKIPIYLGAAVHRSTILNRWSDLRVPKRAILGPPAYVDRPFYQYSWELLRWYDYWLKGLDSGIMAEPPIRVFIRGAEEWKAGQDWPLPETKWIPFALHANRSLCDIEPWPGAESASYDDAPGNRNYLKYFSPPMVENTEVVGPCVLKLYASCRGTDANFFVGLWDAEPDGREVCLNRGYLKASHREIDKKLSQPWYPYHTHVNPQPLVPGQIYEFAIDLSNVANLFKAGHRVVLKISGADDTPENLSDVKMDHLGSQTPNTITIYHDAGHPSHILLPITKGNVIGAYVSGGDISLKSREFMELK